MSRKKKSKPDKVTSWYVFTPYGAFHQSGETARIALNRFMRIYPGWEIAGIFRDDLIIKPPSDPNGAPFLCMFTAGQLRPKPPIENPADNLTPEGQP